MDLRLWLNRISLFVSVPLAIYMVGQPNIIDPNTANQIHPTTEPQYHLVKPDLQKLGSEPPIQIPQEKSQPAVDSETSILAKAKEFSSIQDFFELKIDQETRELLSQMQADRFQTENPYHNLTNVYPVALILSKGVAKWNRHVFRSSDFNQEYGYDVVKYEITHDDTSTSYILAYREKSLDQRLWLGEEDQRPTLTSFLVNRGDGRVFRMNFMNGEIVQSDNVDLSVALEPLEDKVEAATPIASRNSF